VNRMTLVMPIKQSAAAVAAIGWPSSAKIIIKSSRCVPSVER